MLRDFGEIENLQVSPSSIARFVANTENKIERSLIEDLTKARPDWQFKRKTDEAPSAAARPRRNPCHSHGPGCSPSSWAAPPAPSKPPTRPPVVLPRLRVCAPTRFQARLGSGLGLGLAQVLVLGERACKRVGAQALSPGAAFGGLAGGFEGAGATA